VKSRILTAIALLAVFLPALLWASPPLWSALMALVVGVAAHEWARLSHFPARVATAYAVGLVALALFAPWLAAEHWPAFQTATIWLGAGFWLVAAPLWLAFGWRLTQHSVRAATGVVVLLPCWAALGLLRDAHVGVLLGVLALVWLADSVAYFAGRAFGRNKLAPAISPGKTWEGVAGAFVGVMAYIAVVSALLDAQPLPALFVVAAALVYFSVLGDLFESWIKRVAEIKDSGHLLPGHGGVLDRIDALTAVLPLAAAALLWLGGRA
jgi:phosphatidate cytidylyltransferase